jgi:acetyl esterase/lipase
MGHSSGAHLAALVALEPSYLAAEGLSLAVVRRVVGVSGQGAYDLHNVAHEDVVALCDVDASLLGGAAKEFPKAAQF